VVEHRQRGGGKLNQRLVYILLCASLFVTAGVSRAQQATVHESPHKKLERTCEKCHVATSFNDIRFDHDETGYPLSGLHSRAKCLDCHNVEDFSKIEQSCGTCHQDIHRSRLGDKCERCHSVSGWEVFDAENIHENTNFPIQGRHLLLDCAACHPGMPTADFRRAWTRCYDCHRPDYENTLSPDHLTGGFSTVCQDCHEMTGWRPAYMPDHDAFFPIFSGTHNKKWSQCLECHVVPGNFRIFECIECHEHLQPEMDPKHQGIPGYAFNSPACYSCHPTGEAGDFLEHDGLFFPVFSGAHNRKWDNCSECHPTATNKKEFTCIDCHAHTRELMDDKHLGEVDLYEYDSAACYDCHPRGVVEEDGR
jgi:hypothetical protein